MVYGFTITPYAARKIPVPFLVVCGAHDAAVMIGKIPIEPRQAVEWEADVCFHLSVDNNSSVNGRPTRAEDWHLPLRGT